MRERWHGMPRLENRLPVQVLRLDISYVLVLRSGADKDIGRERLAVHDLYKVATRTSSQIVFFQ